MLNTARAKITYFLANVKYIYVVVRPSVVCLLSVCNVRAPYSIQAIEIFDNISTPFGTLAIC